MRLSEPHISNTKDDKAYKGKIALLVAIIQKGPQSAIPQDEKVTTTAVLPPPQQAKAHEEEKSSPCYRRNRNRPSGAFVVGPRAATRSKVPSAIDMALKFSASQNTVFPEVLNNQKTIEPMISGRAASAFP